MISVSPAARLPSSQLAASSAARPSSPLDLVVEEGFNEVGVDDLWLPLEQPLPYIEHRQVLDLVRLVQQGLHNPAEERTPC